MNVVKRRWPDLLIGLLVLLLLGGFAALLLGKNPLSSSSSVTPPAGASAQKPSGAGTETTAAPPATSDTPAPTTTDNGGAAQGGSTIPTIPSAPVTGAATSSAPTDQAAAPVTTPSPTPARPARTGGAVPTSEARTPTRNDYRISLGSYGSNAAVQAATDGVSKLGYTVYPIAVASGVVAQVGPFATREAATQALADIQRALPGALLYPPRNAPASDTAAPTTPAASAAATRPAAATATTSASSSAAPSGPVYLQVGAYKTTAAAQTAVSRVRDLGLEPSVNAPAGKLVTVVVGPFEGRALSAAESKLQAGGIDSFRVR